MAAVKVEDVKAEGIAVDVDALAADGFAAISEADRYRLKVQGVCTQRQTGAFMLRIRVPGGKATPEQIRRVADLADTYGAPSVHITTRGGLEVHHVAIEDVRAMWTGLAEVGLTTKGTCGDTIRNVIGCAHAGTYAGEVLPIEPFAQLLHDRIVAITDTTNISRKMNPAIACSPHCDEHVATSDIGFVAIAGEHGAPPTFTVWGAGGLGAAPHLAIELRRGLAQEDLVPAFDAIVAIGMKYGDRSSRAKAKIKMLVDTLGADRVRALYDAAFADAKARGDYAGVSFGQPTGTAKTIPAARAGGVVQQRQPGLFTIPALVPMGELACAAARTLADAAERFGDGIVHLTPDQNAELQGVASADVAEAVALLEDLGLRTTGRGSISDVVSCVGLEYCPLALTHAMTMGEEIAVATAHLRDDARYADFRIHVSGCPHSCAKHQVADIGLAGALVEYEGAKVEAFQLFLGGNAHDRVLATPYTKRIPRVLVTAVVARLCSTFEEHAIDGERFSETVARIGRDVFFHAIESALDNARLPLPKITEGRLVVIGNGMAGSRFVEELRERSPDAYTITVLGDEPYGGYNRIMLSGVLGGFRDANEIITHPHAWYGQREVKLHSGTRAVAIDRERRIVTCFDGTDVPYDLLVIATGSRAMIPPLPGLDAPHVFAFRTIDDCARIRTAARGVKRAIVLGGGLLGLEAASGLRALGVTPTVVHLAPTLMEMQLDPAAGRTLQTRIEALGIVVRTDARAACAYDDASGRGIELATGERIEAELIVVCCGIVANTELARSAGLTVERGIVVDDGLRTDDEHIFAIGECAQHGGRMYGLVEPLWEQCAVLADRLTRRHRRYAGSKVGTKLKVAGVNVVALGERDARPGDRVIVAIEADGSFRRAIERDGILVGAQVVGDATAAAAFAQQFERGSALPGSLAGFVFGIDGIARTAAPLAPDDERICVCNEVSRSVITDAIAGGAHDVAEIGRQTLAGTGCGTCRGELAAMIIATNSAATR